VALKIVDIEQLITILKDNILSRFGVPKKLIIDNGSIFIGFKFTNFCGEYGIMGRLLFLQFLQCLEGCSSVGCGA
jgi:hypothetical protein